MGRPTTEKQVAVASPGGEPSFVRASCPREREARTNAGSPARLPRCYQNCSQELRGLAFRGLQCCERFTCLLFHVRVKAVSMRVHGDDRGEVVYAKMPHGFRDSEFHQVHAYYTLDRA